jgi:predicted acyl esterase
MQGRDYFPSDMGPVSCVPALARQPNLAVYIIAGYYDSGCVQSAARFHQALRAAGLNSKLTAGPWTHGCRRQVRPPGVRLSDNPGEGISVWGRQGEERGGDKP